MISFLFVQQPPVPFEYSFAAGRAPGNKPDRYVIQRGDEHGVVEVLVNFLQPFSTSNEW